MSKNTEFQTPSVGQAVGVIAVFAVAYMVIAVTFRVLFWGVIAVASLFTKKDRA